MIKEIHIEKEMKKKKFLTLCLLVSSADNLYKQIGLRPGLIKRLSSSGSKLVVSLQECFEKG